MKEVGDPDVSEEEAFRRNKVVLETLPGFAVLYSRRQSFAYMSSCLPLGLSCAL